MTTYILRKDSEWQYTVTKWDFGVVPVQVYRIEKHNTYHCNCPSGSHRATCKHVDMLRDWIKRGMPMEEIAA